MKLSNYITVCASMFISGLAAGWATFSCPYEGRECEPIMQQGFAYVREPKQDSGTEIIAYPLDSFTIRKIK